MGIQPIDLQTMYSQLSNVSKTFSGQQQAQLTEAMQQQNNIKQNLEKVSKVQEASNEQGITNNVNSDGSNSTSYENQKRNNQNKQTEDESFSENTTYKSKSPYLGTIIDITR